MVRQRHRIDLDQECKRLEALYSTKSQGNFEIDRQNILAVLSILV